MYQQNQQQNQKFKNILGEEEEDLVCDFLNCYDKFSLHGNRSHQNEFNCVCNHPHVMGVTIRRKRVWQIRLNDIAQAAGVTELTLRNRFKDLKSKLELSN
jgi:hypothetical protein